MAPDRRIVRGVTDLIDPFVVGTDFEEDHGGPTVQDGSDQP